MSTERIPNSILQDIKIMFDQQPDDPSFDTDIMIHINSTFFDLNQLGVGPVEGFEITDETAVWSDFIGTNKNLNAVKSYIQKRVQLLFDPPGNGFLVEAIKDQINKMEWSFAVEMDRKPHSLGGHNG